MHVRIYLKRSIIFYYKEEGMATVQNFEAVCDKFNMYKIFSH